MKLTKYVPGETLFGQMACGIPSLERLFGEFDRGTESNGEPASRIPRTNIHEEDNAYVFTMEMPGVNRDEVEIHIEGDRLTIKGGQEAKTEEKNFVRREYRASRYERSFGLGSDIDSEKVAARMENGVLIVTLPKRAEKVGRKIEIS